MPTPERRREFHALCYEHHREMKMTEVHASPAVNSTYACQHPDCVVRYTPSNGYFLFPRNGRVARDMTPHVCCIRDGRPMYLAEIDPQRRDFRLWRCPQCDSTRVNEEQR